MHKKIFSLLALLLYVISWGMAQTRVIPGDERTDQYFPLLQGKRIAIFSNHTGMIGNRHLLDILLENHFDVTAIFSPEHGFRGQAEAGEHINNSVDE